MTNGTMIVTGGGRGIGAAISRQAAAAGYSVCINYMRDAQSAEKLVRELNDTGSSAIAVQGDVARRKDVIRLFERADEVLGPLSALVNNAAIAGRIGRFAEADPETMSAVIDTNVKGVLWCCQEAVKRMSTRYGGKGGAIVNLSSGSATLGSPGDYVWYAASKGAVDSLTIGLGKELARENIRVNAVAPGFVDTGMHAAYGLPERISLVADSVPMGRAATPEEIASSVLWLLSENAGYTTATILRVAGGR